MKVSPKKEVRKSVFLVAHSEVRGHLQCGLPHLSSGSRKPHRPMLKGLDQRGVSVRGEEWRGPWERPRVDIKAPGYVGKDH